jgi:Tol biopolymer transport system component
MVTGEPSFPGREVRESRIFIGSVHAILFSGIGEAPSMKMRSGLAVALAIMLLVSGASGQYFGRNKVRYKNFDFKVLYTRHFNVYYYGSLKERANTAAQMLERWHTRYQKIFHFPLHNQPVILYESPADFEQTNVIDGIIPQEVGGVTEPLGKRIIVALTGVNADDNHVLGHELVHAFQFAALSQHKDLSIQALSVPTWFVEGMAEYLSIGGEDAFTTMWMRDAVLYGRAPTIAKASDEYLYFPYRFGHSIWAYIDGTHGDSSLAPLYEAVLKRGWVKGFQEALHVKFDTLSKGWPAALKAAYPVKGLTSDTGSKIGKALIAGQGGYNLSPALSPDGRSLVFLSTRDMFSFELYLADAATGKTLSKLTSSTRDQRFEEISYINSAGAWSPDGKTFAMAVYDKGKNAIAFFNMTSKKVDKLVSIRDVDAIYQLSWSPDGRSLAFFGTKDGYGRLYRCGIGDETAEPLTERGYSDIEPVWSPDGKTIAFVTDRGPGTILDSLTFGPLQLGFLDVTTKAVSTAAISAKAMHTSPQYSPDGKSLYFIADPDGIANIYRYDLASHNFFKVTNVATGVAGLTAISPALSIAKNTGKIAFNVFERGAYTIYVLPDSLSGGTPYSQDTSLFAGNAGLPPCAGGKIVAAYLRDHTTGFPDSLGFISKPYHPRLTSVTEGQAYGGGGYAAGYGIGIAAGGYMLFSDELNDHELLISLQIDGDIQDFGGQIEYFNQANRINWGISISHIPQYYEGIASGTGSFPTVDTAVRQFDTVALPINIDTIETTRLYLDNISLFAQYPLSTNRRIEASAGFTRYTFSENEEIYLSDSLGNLLDTATRNPPAIPPLNLFDIGLGYVGDYSYYGFTGPISGKRYEFEVSPTTGTLTFASVYADYRYYWFLRPVTLAFRALHVGYYGSDAESDPFNIMYLGDPTLIRGYWLGPSTGGSDSTQIARQNADYNRLIGSRIAVGNFEARIPLLGTKQFGLIDFRYLPTDFIAFFDGGLAWTAESAPVLQWSRNSTARIPLFSTGIGVRFNLFGAIIAEVDYAYPFQQAGNQGMFTFNLSPGW